MTGENSLGASFIPIFTRYLHSDPPRSPWEFARKVFWDMAVLLIVVAALGVMFSRQRIGIYTILGGNPGVWSHASFLNRIMFPVIIFIGLSALASAILNSVRVFALPAATPIFFNLTLIAFSFAVLYQPIVNRAPPAFQTPAVALAVAVLIGGVIQLAIQIPALIRRGMNMMPALSVSDPGVRSVARLDGPSVFPEWAFIRSISSWTPSLPTSSRTLVGSITSLYIADRLMQLVLGSYAIAMSTALLPAMSHQIAAGNWTRNGNAPSASLCAWYRSLLYPPP